MKIKKETTERGEIIIFDYEGRDLEPGDRERIVTAYQEHRAALSGTKECRRVRESGLSACLACISRELCRLIDLEEIRRIKEELVRKGTS